MIHLFLKHTEQRWTKHHDIMIFCLMDQWWPMNPLPQPSPRRCPHRFRPRWDQYRRVSTLRWIAPLVTMFVVWDGPGLAGGVLMEVSTATAATVSRWIRPSGKSSCNPLRGGQAVRSLRGRSAMLRSISCGHGRLTIGKSPHIPTENHNEPHWARVGSPLCKAWYCKQAATLDFLGVSCLIFPQRPEHYQSPLLHIRQRHTSWFDQAKKSKSCIPVLQPDKNSTESLNAQGRPRFWSSWPNYTAASQKVEFGLWCHEGAWVFLACDIGLAPALQLDQVIHDEKCIFKSFQICSFRISSAQLLRVLLRNILSVVLQEKSSQCGPWRKQRNLSSSVLIFRLTGFKKHRPKFAVSLHVEWFETSWRKKNHLHKTIGFNDLQKLSMLSQRFLLLF